MKVGIGTPLQSVSFERVRDLWARAEQLGFDSAFVGDHLVPLGGFGPFGSEPSDPVLESWTALTALAASTSRIRLGTMVASNTFRHPGLLAKMAATLDVISGGRLVVGLGAGYYEHEHDAFGLELGAPRERLERLAEACEIIDALLAQGTCSFAGRFYTLKDAPCSPGPVQRPRPPLLIGGAGERYTFPVVARWADAWDLPSGMDGITPESFQTKHGSLIRCCGAIGRDHREIETSVALFVFADEDHERALARRSAFGEACGMDDALAARHVLAGDPASVVADLRAFSAAGVDHMIVAAHAEHHAADVELIGKAVLPALRAT